MLIEGAYYACIDFGFRLVASVINKGLVPQPGDDCQHRGVEKWE